MALLEQRKHLLEYWAVLRRRRWVVYLAVATVGTSALVGSFLVTPLYRATVTLQVERQTPEILTFRDLGTVDYSWAAYQDFYQTQYKILASDAVARRAVRRLGLTSHPLFDPTSSRPSLRARLRAMLPSPRSRAAELSPEDVAVARLQTSLEVSPVRNSHLILVSWVSPDPKLAATVANAVGEAYVQFNLQAHTTISDQASEFLVGQIDTLKREIADLEGRLQGYGEAKGIVTIDDSSNITLRALSDVSQRRTEARSVLAQKEAAHRAAAAAPPEALPEVLRSDLIARLKQEYASLEADYSEQSRRFKDDWPGLQTLRSKLDQVGTRLGLETEEIALKVRAAAEADYHKALAEFRSLDALLTQQQEAAQRLKRDAAEYASLQSDVQKKRETLNTLIGRQNEMAVSTRLKDLDATSSNIHVVDPAREPVAPFRPSIRFNVLLAIVLGLGLGVGVAFFLDYLDNTIKSPAELQGVVALPTLAVVPHHGPAAPTRPRLAWREAAATAEALSVDLVTHLERRAPASEAYRELRTSLLLSNPGHPPRRVMVTSALPEEGKSATAVNLAVAFAQLGRRTLIVDTDLRRPRLHRLFRVSNGRGLSTYLSGLEEEVSRLVEATQVPGLDLLPSGPVPPNPSELLDSSVFAQAGARLAALGYDHVVFDSPPLLSVADPVIIATAAEATLIVVRAGRTPRESLRLAVEKLTQAGVKPTGVVFNALDLHGDGYYGAYRYHVRDDRPAERDDGSSLAGRAGA